MREPQFRAWLDCRFPPPVGTALSRFENCRRIEKHYGDLDCHHRQDRLQSIFDSLAYSTDDKRHGRPNPSPIPLIGCDLYNNLAMYRQALRLYEAFCDGQQAIPNPMPSKPPLAVPAPRNGSWPVWQTPGESALLELAHLTTSYIRFLHPSIVAAVVENNEKRAPEWASRLAHRGVDSGQYLWPGSPCAFPGVRRYAGATEIAQYRRRQALTKPFRQALDVDDNDHPKHVWSHVFRGKPFQKEGPSGYSLAHLADHKEHDDRGAKEFIERGSSGKAWQTCFGLFTSVANTVYTPEGLMRPTDFSYPLRNLIQRKAVALYAGVCNLLPPQWSIRGETNSSWSIDAFDWAEPVGGTEHLATFLRFREARIETLLSPDYLLQKYLMEREAPAEE
jgi:hypothetical protein